MHYFDPADTALWDYRVVDRDVGGQVIADIRDYTDVASQWLVHHILPANLWQADDNFVTDFTAQFERSAVHGGSIEQPAPMPLDYERQTYNFNIGTYDIDPNFTTGVPTLSLTGPSESGSAFDISAYFYAGAGVFAIGAKLTFQSNMLDIVFGALDFLFPVVLDLDGDGIRLTPRADSNTFFNADGDPALERTAWIGPGDGLLAINLDGNDTVTTANEIAFANHTANPNDTDAQALAALYDTNHNGSLDPGDARWNDFRVWRDFNRNGRSENGEVVTLAALGITALSLATSGSPFSLPDGSRINGFGSFTMNGTTRAFADVGLAFQTNGFTRTEYADGFYYTSEDNTAVRTYLDMRIFGGGGWYAADPQHPNDIGYDSGPLATNPNVVFDGVFGSQRPDILVFAANHAMTLYGDLGNDMIKSNGTGNDVLDGGGGADVLVAGWGDDTIYFDWFDTTVDGGPGYDTGIYTSPWGISYHMAAHGLEALIANAGDDQIAAGGSVAVYVDGRAGNDIIWGSPAGDVLVGGTGQDTLYGGDGIDLLIGGAQNDVLYGEGGDDVLFAGEGTPGGVEDILIGGPGNDTYNIDGQMDAVVENPGEGTDTVRTTANYTLWNNTENLALVEGAGCRRRRLVTRPSQSFRVLSQRAGSRLRRTREAA